MPNRAPDVKVDASQTRLVLIQALIWIEYGLPKDHGRTVSLGPLQVTGQRQYTEVGHDAAFLLSQEYSLLVSGWVDRPIMGGACAMDGEIKSQPEAGEEFLNFDLPDEALEPWGASNSKPSPGPIALTPGITAHGHSSSRPWTLSLHHSSLVD
jgi:hypothetical protein